jgi:CubicO group peptidase (beta-lactamase class C family)
MTLHRFLHSVSLLCISALVGCGPQPAPGPRPRGDRFDAVRELAGRQMRRHHVASLAIAVAQDGRIVWEEAWGWADRARHVPATPRSVYALASVTKLMTATGLMTLAERGRVDLDRPANDYLGDVKLTACVGRADDATLRRLLHFSAGLPMQANVFLANGGLRPPPMDESIRHWGIIVSEPGREYQYSNFAYGVLDQVIERASGGSYPDFMRTEVFAPLGLDHTTIGLDSTLARDAVTLYAADGTPVPRWETDHRGASAAWSSVHDLVRFGMFQLGAGPPGAARVLSARGRAALHEPDSLWVESESPRTTRAGFGCAVVDLEGRRFVLATGGAPGTVARLALLPADRVVVAILMNSGVSESYSPWDIEWQAFRAVVPGFPLQPRLPPAVTSSAGLGPVLGVWTGTIRTGQGDLPVRLAIRGPRDLKLGLAGAVALPIPAPNPLGGVRLHDGVLEAPFLGTLPTPEARRSAHVLALRARLDADTLYGSISAVATDRRFWLPYWIRLVRARS